MMAVAIAAAGSAPARAGQPFRAPDLVAVLANPQRGQAVLLDRAHGAYRVVRRGDRVDRVFTVFAIQPQQVVLRRRSGNRREEYFVLPVVPRAAGDQGSALPRLRAEVAAAPVDPHAGNRVAKTSAAPLNPYAPGAAAKTSAAPLDPYAGSAGKESAAPLDPYAGSAGKESAAPLDPYAGGAAHNTSITASDRAHAPIPSVLAPPKSRADAPRQQPQPPVLAETTPPGLASGGRTRPATRSSAAATPPALHPARPARTARISRHRFMDALADFDTVAKEVQIVRARRGGARIAAIARGSLFYRLGLRKGDVVRKVAGISINSVDDAASIYARLMRIDRFSAEVIRGGHTLVLRFRFTR